MYHFEMIRKAETNARKWVKELSTKGGQWWLPGAMEVFSLFQQLGSGKHKTDGKNKWATIQVNPSLSQALIKNSVMIHELMSQSGVDSRNWVDLLMNEDLQRYMSVFHQGIPAVQKSQTVQLNQVFSTYNFETYGRKVYEISSGLGDQLLHTELRGLTTDDLQLPFESVYLILPSNFPHRVWNDMTQWHQIEGVYITEDPFAVRKCETDEEVIHTAKNEPRTRAWRLFVIGKSKNPKDPFDDALYHYGIRLPKETPLEDALAQHEKDDWGDRDIPRAEPMRLLWRPIFRFIMNAMLYATWPSAEMEHVFMDKEAAQLWQRHGKAKGTKREKLRERLRRTSQQRIHVLGKSIRVDRTRGTAEEKGNGTGASLLVRTRVPGHWQHYWTGKGKTKRIRKFKVPFWRGPQEGILSNPKHTLG